MTAARDDNFMALPGMEVDSNTRDTTRHRLDGAPCPRRRPRWMRCWRSVGRAKGVPFEERDRDMMATA